MITEESFIDFRCPYCEEPVSFPQDSAGFAQACPNCTESLIVPDDGSEVGGQIPLPITTARLTVRRLAPGDWKDLLEMVSEEEPTRYVHTVPFDEEGILHWLEAEAHVKVTTPDQMFHLAIERQDGGKVIGYMRFRFTDAQRRQIEFSLFLNRKFQRQGYGVESVEALFTFCFEGLRLHRVSAWCESQNTAACRLLEKSGMRREGEFLKDIWLDGQWLNSVWYGVLAEECAEGESQTTQ